MVTQSIRNLQLNEGNQGAFLDLSNRQSENIAQGTPTQIFNQKLMEMLKQYQTLGTRPFAEQQFNAQEEQARRVFQTPQSLIGAAPSVQSGVRTAATGALEPTISGAKQGMQTFGEQIKGLGSAIEQARAFGEDIKKQEEFNQKTAQTIVEAAIKSGSAGLKELLRTSPDIFKKAGYGTKEFSAIATGLEGLETEEKRKKDLEIEKLKAEIAKIYADVKATTGGAKGSALDSINLVKSSLERATNLAGASGRSGLRRNIENWLVGSTDYTNLVAETNTLRTNVLTMMTDPDIKKFFGPQMSEADVRLMTSAGTTLNPELQSPANMRIELARLKDLINRAEIAVKQGLDGSNNQNQTGTIRMKGPKGIFDVPANQVKTFEQNGYTRI